MLFVTDSSGSIEAEKEKIAGRIGRFIRSLPQNADFRIAVMPAHSGNSPHSGRVHKKGNHPHVLDSRVHDEEEIARHLRANLLNLPKDVPGQGEMGMYSFSRSIEGGPLASNRAKGFFREDAALAVIFISDENDICARYPAGVRRVPDPSGVEAKLFAKYCAGITPESVLAKTRAFMGDRPFLFGAIVYNQRGRVPRDGQNEYGWGYMELIELSGGISVGIGQRDYGPSLAEIGALMARKMGLLHDFRLSRANVDPSTIDVEVDTRRVTDFSYHPTLNQVHLADAGQAGSRIEIAYCEIQVQPTPTVTPDPTPTATVTPDPTPSPTVTPDPTPTPTVTPNPTPSPTVTPTPEPTSTINPDVTPTPSSSPSPSPTVEPTPTPTITQDPTPTPTVEPTPSPTVTPDPTPTPTVTVTPDPTPTVTPVPTPTVIPDPSPTPTSSPEPTPTVTPDPTPTITPDPTPSPTVEPTPTPTVTPDPTPTPTPTCTGPRCGGGGIGI